MSGNVDAVLVVQQHPKDCGACGGKGRVAVAPMRWRHGGELLLPAWTSVQERPCPWPFGAADLLASLGVAAVLPDGPGGAA